MIFIQIITDESHRFYIELGLAITIVIGGVWWWIAPEKINDDTLLEDDPLLKEDDPEFDEKD